MPFLTTSEGVVFQTGAHYAHDQLINHYRDPLAKGLGFQSWSHDPSVIAANSAPTAGTIYGVAMYLNAGQVVTNILYNINIAGGGAVPTNIFGGLCSATAMLRQTADIKASAIWTAASTIGSAPLISPVTIPASAMYYGLFLQVGSWAVTQHTMNRTIVTPSGVPSAGFSAVTFGVGAASLPADGASPGVLSSGSALRYFVGVS